MADVGSTFEDLAEITTEPAEPEPASAPEAPSVTLPDEVIEEAATSQALVASDNPQNVLAPDTGTGDVVEPDAAEPPAGDAPAPDTEARSGGEDASAADVAVLKPVEPDTETATSQGTRDDESSEPPEPPASSSVETVSPSAPALAPSTSAIILPEPEVQQPVLPKVTVAPTPDVPEALTAEDSEDGSNSAVTRSLRPPKERPSEVDSGAREDTRTARSAGTVESPLTAYKRTGIDPFATGSGGTRSGMTSFSGSRNPGNASTTNYTGRVLVQLNRAPVLYPSAQGTAQVSFLINPDGSLAWVNILRSSGSADIARAATAQVRSAAPFPPPPQGTSQRLVFIYRNR